MTVKLAFLEERFPYLVEELGDNVKVISTIQTEDRTFVNVEVTINNNTDVLNVFHAGVNAGVAQFTS